MSRILDQYGSPVDSRERRSLLYGISLNLDSGSAEFFCNSELLQRIPQSERRRILTECLRDLPLAFKVPTDA